MVDINSTGSLLWVALLFVMTVAASAALLWRRAAHKWLLGLSLAACIIALGFTPVMRLLPENIGLPFFLIGLWPSLAVITVAIIASLVQIVRTCQKKSWFSLVLGLIAVGLFYLNATTSLIWPYR